MRKTQILQIITWGEMVKDERERGNEKGKKMTEEIKEKKMETALSD